VRPAITLIELLVVIALVGIIAGTGWPTLTGWNCKQELRNDFETLNSFFENARVEAINRNKTVLVRANKSLPSNGPTYQAYLLPNKSCRMSSAAQSLSLQIPNLTISNKSRLYGTPNQCFHADGTATSIQAFQFHQIQRECSGKNHSYQTIVFGATGLFEKKVYFHGTTGYLDL